MCRILSVCILCLSVLLSGTVSGQTRSSLETRRKKLQRDIEYTNRLLRENQKKQKTSVAQLQKIEHSIRQRTRLISTIEQEIQLLNAEIDSNLAYIRILEIDLEILRADYAQMVVNAYLYRKTSNRWISVLSAKGVGQAIRRALYHERVSELRRAKAAHIRQTWQMLEEHIALLEQNREQKAENLREINAQTDSLEAEKAERERQVTELRSKENELMAAIRKKQAESEQLTRKINEIIQRELAEARRKAEEEARRKKEEEEKRRAAAASSGNTGGSGGAGGTGRPGGTSPSKPAETRETPAIASLSRDFASNRGKLPWPVERGVVVGKFGRHPHPVFSHVEIQRDGVDIGTDKNASVRAVFKGEVSTVIRMPGYEHVVIIRHGTYLTVYGNLEQVIVKKGDAVQTRQRIGTAYHDEETGRTTVHFRVMAGEVPENPELWMAK